MVDTEVLYSPGFLILAVGSVGAVVFGYIFSIKNEMVAFSIPTLLIVIATCIVASYYFASK